MIRFPAWDWSAHGGARRERGAVLVGLLWCLVLLSVLVIGVLHSSRTDLRLARMHADRIQARYLAIAGVERAKALLYQNARERSRSGLSHDGSLFDAPSRFRDVPFGRGTYRVMRGGRIEDGGGLIFGVDDEESRLNLNRAEVAELGRLEGMTPEIPPSIADWRDGDNQVTPGGAEAEYYLAMKPPYEPRNGPFPSVRELGMVRGIDAFRLYGTRGNDSELPENDNDDDDSDIMPDGKGAMASRNGGAVGGQGAAGEIPGWARFLTVHSGVANVSATGQERVNLQTADETALTGVRGITPDIAKAIVAHRGQNRLESIAHLLEVRAAPPGGNPGQPNPVPGPTGFPSGPGGQRGGGPAQGGPLVIDQNLLMEIADSVTVDEGSVLEGLVNVNTAPWEVLVCLPGITRELAHAIIAYRGSTGFFPNTAALLNVPSMTTDIFKQLAAKITVRSETFRILAEGRIKSSGVRQRVRAVVRVGLRDVQTLGYRENDL